MKRLWIGSCVLLGVLGFFQVGVAHGGKAEDVFRGKVIITTKRPPARFSSNAAFIRFLQANRKVHLWPDKKEKSEWRFEFMAFFSKPLNDLEVNVKFFDITEGKKFIAADNFYTPSRGQRIFSSSMTLNKPRFSIDRKYLMAVADARGRVLATTTFYLRGERTHYNGKVTFTDEETRVKDD